jgi:hypothetical protein
MSRSFGSPGGRLLSKSLAAGRATWLATRLAAVFACFLICAAIFVGLIVIWGLLVAPFVTLSAAGPVLVGLFVLATSATVLIWRWLYLRRLRLNRR